MFLQRKLSDVYKHEKKLKLAMSIEFCGTFISNVLTMHFLLSSRRAHTITALVLITLGLIYVSLIEQTPNDSAYNTKRGLIAVVVVFILIGIIHMPDGPFVRPHPILWRLVLCLNILYVLLLIFMLFQVCKINS